MKCNTPMLMKTCSDSFSVRTSATLFPIDEPNKTDMEIKNDIKKKSASVMAKPTSLSGFFNFLQSFERISKPNTTQARKNRTGTSRKTKSIRLLNFHAVFSGIDPSPVYESLHDLCAKLLAKPRRI